MPDALPTWLILAIIAPAIGSFIGVLAVRLPEGRGVVAGRSVCDHCGHVPGPIRSQSIGRGAPLTRSL